MAVPFRRTSKTKKRMRRTHLKKTVGAISLCPNCGEPIRPHRMCAKCGYYKGKEVVKVTKEEVETPKKEVKKVAKKNKIVKDNKTVTPKVAKVAKKVTSKRTADK